MMTIKFINNYLSIKNFNSVELSSFSILTGLNGSGKSHFLQAIINGNVNVGIIPKGEIILFDNRQFNLDSESIINSRLLQDERRNIFNAISGLKNYVIGSPKFVGHILDLISLSKKKEVSFYSLSKEHLIDAGLSDIQLEYENYIFNTKNKIAQTQPNNNNNVDLIKTGLLRLLNELEKPIEHLTKDEFDGIYFPIAYKNNFLISQFGKIFSAYWEKWELNSYKKYRNATYNENHFIYSEQEFLTEFGEKPWDIVNNILSTFGSLNYKVNSPEGLERGNDFQVSLFSTKDGETIVDFSNLSSGEKIMLALVSVLLKTKIDKNFPSLLLLDEIDASLHPSMTKHMLDVIQKELVLKIGLNVILVTHSPSTVALAPEDSIFIMNKSGSNRIKKSNNEEALHILSEGFASMTNAESNLKVTYNISKATNHVLLTEGITDRIIIEAAWKKLENCEVPFDVQDCFDASFLANLFRRGEIFNNYPDKIFIALFDFDTAGFSAWNNLSNFELVETNPKKGLLKKHKTKLAYALLLPVPDGIIEKQVIQSGIKTFEDKSHLPIELLFYQVETLQSNFINEPQVGGGSLIKFNADKTKFSEKVATQLTSIDFLNLKPLFETLKTIFK